MYHEAMVAIRQGERERARDLLVRLIKKKPDQPQYWLWMSAVVDTVKERNYCLKEVLRLDPENKNACLGLIMTGALPPDQSLAIPLRKQRRDWQAHLGSLADGGAKKALWIQSGVYLAILLGVILLVVGGLMLSEGSRDTRAGWGGSQPTGAPSPTHHPSPSPVVRTLEVTFSTATPLWMLLNATYTPTPLYVNTPHPRSEAYRMAMHSYQRRDWDGMINLLQQVATLEPDAIDLYFYIGEAYRMQHNLTRAMQYYERVLAMDADFAPAYLARSRALLASSPAKASQAQADLQKAIQLDPHIFEAYLDLAQQALANQDAEAALDYLEVVAELQPNSFLLYYYRGQAYLWMNELDAALENALKAHKIDLTHLDGYRLVAEVYLAQGDYVNAIQYLDIYCRYNEDDPEAFTWLGMAYASLGESEPALKAFQAALSINRIYDQAYLQRGLLYLEMESHHLALKDLQEAVRLQPKTFRGRMSLGKAYLQVEAYGKAYQEFSTADAYDETETERAEMIYWRAQSLEHLNRVAAVRDWRELVNMPVTVVPEEWRQYALERLAALLTPSPTATRQPTRTPTP